MRGQPGWLGCWLTLLACLVIQLSTASAQDTTQTSAGGDAAVRGTAADAEGSALADVIRVVIKSPCFDSDSLADEVEHWLGRDHVDGRIEAIRIRASQGTLSFAIEVRGQPPTNREFPELPRDCAEMSAAIGLSLALAIDALESDLPPVAKPATARWLLSAELVGTTGLPSALGLGPGLNMELKVSPWLGINVGAWMARNLAEQRLPEGIADLRFNTAIWAAHVGLCALGSLADSLEVAGCTRLHLGALDAASSARSSGGTSHGWYAAAGSVELRWALAGALGLRAAVEVAVPLRGARLVLLDAEGTRLDDVRFPRVIAVLRLGPSLSF